MGLLGQNPFSNAYLCKHLLFQSKELMLYNNNAMCKVKNNYSCWKVNSQWHNLKISGSEFDIFLMEQ